MKTASKNRRIKLLFITLNFFLICGLLPIISQTNTQNIDTTGFVQYTGIIVNGKTNKSLEFASIAVNNTNISTISNIDGEFLLKVPKKMANTSITVTYMGFKNKIIPLENFSSERITIKMDESFEKLPDVNLVSVDPYLVIRKVKENRKKNYEENPLIMTAFYRESIKKRKNYASLTEAVVDVYKQPYRSFNYDYVKLKKVRKSTDYRRIDTLIIKLQGGPYNNLHMDMVKNKGLFFTEDIFEIYNFTFDKVISIQNKLVFVIDFIQKQNVIEPFYKGKLYIDSQSYAMVKAVFSLNLENLNRASRFFVKKKPANADVIPVRTQYIVDYRMNEGKWHFGYSRIELSFKINWKKKIFNSLYHITIEMAITDWAVNDQNLSLKNREKLKRNVILNDRASGFSNPEFWGEYNVIEPDKSIENAINKIKKKLNKN